MSKEAARGEILKRVLRYISESEQRYIAELIDFLKIPSVSADPERVFEVRNAAQWCVELLKRIGFENVGLQETSGNPAVFGEWLHAGDDRPTIMCYGHYDVQPEEPVKKWRTLPFEPAIREGRIYGRGSSDDKGQILTHLFALEALMTSSGELPVNVKIFIEGEEEGGTGGTAAFVEEHRDLLACDAVVISDSAWYLDDVPTMCYALRGICYLEVSVKGPERDLHSGMYGGRVLNPLNAMAKIIALLHDENNMIQVPGFYDDVLPLTDLEREEFRAVGSNDNDLKKDLGVPELCGEEGFTTVERNWARPSLDVNGIWGGYSGKGSKTIIPSHGGFKISARLVANQDPQRCMSLIEEYINNICPAGVIVRVKPMHGGAPVMIPTDSPYVRAALAAFENGFGQCPLLVREGGSIPIVNTFMSALNALPILAGFGLAGDNIHAPNENFQLDHYHRGIVTNVHLYEGFSRIKRTLRDNNFAS